MLGTKYAQLMTTISISILILTEIGRGREEHPALLSEDKDKQVNFIVSSSNYLIIHWLNYLLIY